MIICYFDETGDDGYPQFSSEIFVLSSIYMHDSVWKENYKSLHGFRVLLKNKYGIPVNQEFHTKDFVADKSHFHGKFGHSTRREILFEFCRFVSSLSFKTISVVIDKQKINTPDYDVLGNALTYNVQRIENDLRQNFKNERFLIISDEGRVGKMRSTTRRIQKLNYIPSKFGGSSYRKEIECLIEDPMPKPSNESYFIQLADMISFIISLYAKQNTTCTKTKWGNRICNVLDYGNEIELMKILRPIMNGEASRDNEFGIVCYPKEKDRSAIEKSRTVKN